MKSLFFRDVKDGQQFYDGKRWWIKALEDCSETNAVLLGNSRVCCDMGDLCLVWVMLEN